MSRQHVLQVGTAVLVFLFLVGCEGSAPTAVSEAPVATSVPEQAAATLTPEPPPSTPEPPTDTPTPESPTTTPTPELPTPTPTPVPPTETPTSSFANPQSGATFTGELESSEGVGSGTINFKVSDDGNSIVQVEVKLTGVAKSAQSLAQPLA